MATRDVERLLLERKWNSQPPLNAIKDFPKDDKCQQLVVMNLCSFIEYFELHKKISRRQPSVKRQVEAENRCKMKQNWNLNQTATSQSHQFEFTLVSDIFAVWTSTRSCRIPNWLSSVCGRTEKGRIFRARTFIIKYFHLIFRVRNFHRNF